MSKETAARMSVARKIEVSIYTVLGIAMTLLMAGNAAMRYLFDSSIIWSEEVIRIFFVWSMFIAITGGFIRNEHIGFDNLSKIPGAFNVLYRIVYGLCLIIVGAILVYYGGKFTMMIGDVPLAATNLPTWLFMWPGVVAGVVWVLIGLWRLLGIFKRPASEVTP